jgi:hypothetical protein
MSGGVDDRRTCLHCALARVLRAEAPALEARGVTVTMGRSDPVWVPISGTRVYRGIRRVLREAATVAERHVVRLAVIDLLGKPEVEVTAAALLPDRALVFRAGFARFMGGPLPGGFSEGVRP